MRKLADILLAGCVAVAALAGFVDAAISREGDFLAVFGLVLFLAVVIIFRTAANRRTVAIRGDLYRWYSHRAALNGERIDRATDRALAAYRAQLVGDPPNERSP